MMNSLKNSSEMLESASLLERLLDKQGVKPQKEMHLISTVSSDESVREIPVPLFNNTPKINHPPEIKQTSFTGISLDNPITTFDTVSDGEFRDNKLEGILENMCQQSGMIGALIADINGLPIAAYRSPVEQEVFAAFASVLGETMDKAAYFLDQHEANYISIDINYADKAVVKKFIIDDAIFFMIIIIPKHINERGHVEYTVEKLKSVLSIR